jgi:glycosyltransferase involved in cell wall biosynthesis
MIDSMEDPPEPPPVEASAGLPAPRVLIVDLSVRFGGASARALGLLAGLSRNGAALAALEGTPVFDAARRAGADVHPVARSKADPRIVLRLRRIARAGFALIDTQNPQSRFWAGLPGVRSPVALVSTLNSWYLSEHEGRPKGRVYHALEWLGERNVDLYIAVAPEIRDRLLERGIPGAKIALIPNAVAVDAATIGDDPGKLRRAHGLGADIPIVCAVGRLVEAKAYDTLVDAIRILADAGRPVACMIVGEGHLRDALEGQIRRLGLGDLVRLVGFLDRTAVLETVNATDVFVMPSRTEGTPIALLEAAALGRPIVASRAGGIPTILKDGAEAWLVPPDEPRALATAIGLVMDQPLEAARRGAAARARIEREFGLPGQVKATREAYRRALIGHHQRRSRPPAA